MSKLKNQEQLSSRPVMEESVLIRSFKTRHSYEEPETAAKKRLEEMSALRDKVKEVEQRLANIDERFETITQLLIQRLESDHASSKSVIVESVKRSPKVGRPPRSRKRGADGRFISPTAGKSNPVAPNSKNLQRVNSQRDNTFLSKRNERNGRYALRPSNRKPKIAKKSLNQLSEIRFEAPLNRVMIN